MKKTSGFTLVELIVVIAILAILAGIAIPVYSGYINKAKEAADLQKLDAIKTAVVFVKTEAASKEATFTNPTVTPLEVTASTIKIGTTALTADEIAAVNALIGATGNTWSFTFDSGKTTATWNGNNWTLG